MRAFREAKGDLPPFSFSREKCNEEDHRRAECNYYYTEGDGREDETDERLIINRVDALGSTIEKIGSIQPIVP